MNLQEMNKPQAKANSKDLSLEAFAIEELEDRFELLLLTDSNCGCKTQ
jgi:hypothetical protein